MYSQEIADKVCELIASGKSLRQIHALGEMPAPSTVLFWRDKYPEFAEHYTRALEARTELMAEELIEIADGEPDADVNRDRLRVETRKWVAAKLLPKKYGDKQQVEHSGEVAILKGYVGIDPENDV